MTTTREARYLSYNDLNKTIQILDRYTGEWPTGILAGIETTNHPDAYILITLETGKHHYTTFDLHPNDPVTLTGQPSPHTDDPHGLVMSTKYDQETRTVHLEIARNQQAAALHRRTEKWAKYNTRTPRIPDHLRIPTETHPTPPEGPMGDLHAIAKAAIDHTYEQPNTGPSPEFIAALNRHYGKDQAQQLPAPVPAAQAADHTGPTETP